MSDSCYIGRGVALARIRGSNSGYLPLAGEGDISFVYSVTSANIVDSRSGAARVVSSFQTEESVQLQFTSGRFNDKTLRMLFGQSDAVTKTAEVSLTSVLPSVLILNTAYFLGKAKVSNVVVRDATATIISAANYTVDSVFGFITFTVAPGTAPYTVTFDSAEYTQQGHLFTNFIDLDVIVTLTNKITNQKSLVELYKPRLQVSGTHKIVSREFSNLQANLLLFADYTKPDAGILGVYGKTSYLEP